MERCTTHYGLHTPHTVCKFYEGITKYTTFIHLRVIHKIKYAFTTWHVLYRLSALTAFSVWVIIHTTYDT